MRKALLTMITDNLLPYTKEFLENQQGYANRLNYEHVVSTTLHWDDLHPSFSKVWDIYKALQDGYDFIIWADIDVAFMDYGVELVHLLQPDYFMAAYHQTNWKTWVYLCNGLIVMKNTPQAQDYVNRWIAKVETKFMKDHPWEQWYFDELIRETNYANVRACSGPEIGCFCPETWHDGTIWKPGFPTVHFAGSHVTWERRQQVFVEVYQPQVRK